MSWRNLSQFEMEEKFPSRPLQLITVMDKKLAVNEESMKIVQRFDFTGKKTEIISIVGDARGGKSSTLNFILASLGVAVTARNKFEARVNEKTVTKGIWCWGSPV